MSDKPITHQINETALELIARHPEGIRWVDLNQAIQERHPDFHPKTINGCVWKLVERFPDRVKKDVAGLFQPVGKD